jgi:hypothetical protein
LEYFGYYSLVEPFADGYYKTGDKVKAQQLLNKLVNKYQDWKERPCSPRFTPHN